MKNEKSDWSIERELARKFIHIFSPLILVFYFVLRKYFGSNFALTVLICVLVLFIFFEYLRIDCPFEIPLFRGVWNYLSRNKERGMMGGHVSFLIGAIIVLAIFDFRIATVAILMTTFGDMAAALIGMRFGRTWLSYLEDRAWEGILAEYFVDVFIGMVVFFWGFWNDFGVFASWELWIVVGVMAFVATVVETLIYKMDDNLLIPVFSGLAGRIVFWVLKVG